MTAASRRSSGFAELRRFAALALVLPAIAGCGGGGDKRRAQVDRFIKQANAAQQEAAPAFNRANQSYLQFAKGRLAPAEAGRQLRSAESAMRETRDRIAALHAPAQARELQRRLVALFDADAAFAHESTLLASFVPTSSKLTKPLTAVGARLSRRLKAATKPSQQEEALGTYARQVGRVIDRLQRLHPPPILIATHAAEVERLRTVRALALGLRSALVANDSRRVAKLLLRFRRANATRAGAGLSAAGAKAYNRRYLALQKYLQAVERERRRLEKSLD